MDKSTFSSVNNGLPLSSVVKMFSYADLSESNVGLSWVLSCFIVSVMDNEVDIDSFVSATVSEVSSANAAISL